MTNFQTSYMVLLLKQFYHVVIFDSIMLSLQRFTATEILKLVILSFALSQKKKIFHNIVGNMFSIAHAQLALFSKNEVFLRLTIFFFLRNNTF